ncbi:MAG: hypothetical protein J6Y78_04515 [Paludibacteraceae bacterium]|nr:hypothetical protein [Paludibacteraceae bacterium]
MIVSELIEELKRYNPDAEVTTTYSETIELGFMDGDGEYSKEDTPLVFVLGRDWVIEDD